MQPIILSENRQIAELLLQTMSKIHYVHIWAAKCSACSSEDLIKSWYTLAVAFRLSVQNMSSAEESLGGQKFITRWSVTRSWSNFASATATGFRCPNLDNAELPMKEVSLMHKRFLNTRTWQNWSRISKSWPAPRYQYKRQLKGSEGVLCRKRTSRTVKSVSVVQSRGKQM